MLLGLNCIGNCMDICVLDALLSASGVLMTVLRVAGCATLVMVLTGGSGCGVCVMSIEEVSW
jgi:hypothetical protein